MSLSPKVTAIKLKSMPPSAEIVKSNPKALPRWQA